jgi:hypothetical protein
MTNLQLYLAVCLPIIAVLTSLVISLVQISALREEMRAQIAGVREEMREIRADIREIRSDIKLLTGKVYELMGQK